MSIADCAMLMGKYFVGLLLVVYARIRVECGVRLLVCL
jgi:hypothetical protein